MQARERIMLTFRPRTKSQWPQIVLIVAATLLVSWLWTGTAFDPENDEDLVTLEYKCSALDSYDHVPQEVHDECASRIESLKRQEQIANSKNLL